MSRQFTIVGLDCEMTGGRFIDQYKTCQVGIAYGVQNNFVSDVGWPEYDYTDEALRVNKFTHDRIKAGPRPHKVQKKALGWAKSFNPDGKLVAVGFGVHGDLDFIRRDLPELGQKFAWRHINLTGVCTMLGGMRGKYGVYTATSWKKKAKQYAKTYLADLGIPENYHDAGYDALIALYAYEWLKSVIRIYE